MAAVTDMDAHGIGELVCSLLTVERHDSQMALIAPSACVRQLLADTRLNTIFAIYDSEAEALLRIRPTAVAVALSRNGVEQHLPRQTVRLTT
jgi:anti-anti-sigma regulatory factor